MNEKQTDIEGNSQGIAIALSIPEHPLGRVIGYGVLDNQGNWPNAPGNAIQQCFSLHKAQDWKTSIEEEARENGKELPALYVVEIRELPKGKLQARTDA